MEPELLSALEQACSKLRATAKDAEIFNALVPNDLNPQDPDAIATCAKTLVEEHPNCFSIEQFWEALNDDAFRERERAFRSGLSKSRPMVNEWNDVDASRLSGPELEALSKAITGNVNAYDRGLLTRAQSRQKLEDAALNGVTK
jgi:hypothetical protein